MLDFGAGSYPVFFDYNNDSLVDIVVGNYGYHDSNGDPVSSLALLENSGTFEHPEFELVDRDWLSISNINLNTGLNIPALNLHPTFADLNGDSYKDMILGDADGKLHYFTNNGTTPTTFNIAQANYSNIDVGYFAAPQLVDINRDGLIDIIIGEQDGTLNYCPNSGTNNAAIFDTVIIHFGMIDVDSGFINKGFSSPFVHDNNGNYELFVGSYSGKIYHYDNIDNNLNGQFNLITNQFNQLWEGAKSSFNFTDITNDNQPDMILGNYCGGLCYFSSDSTLINSVSNITTDPFNIYPNPTQKILYISSVQMGEIKVTDMLGKTLISEQKITENHTLNLSTLKHGIYIIQLAHNTVKFIKQ